MYSNSWGSYKDESHGGSLKSWQAILILPLKFQFPTEIGNFARPMFSFHCSAYRGDHGEENVADNHARTGRV